MTRTPALPIACTVAALAAACLLPVEAHALWHKGAAARWPGGVVPICFTANVQAQPNFSSFASLLRTNVENTWAKAANLRFTGWGTCSDPAPRETIVVSYDRCGFWGDVGYRPGGYTRLRVDFNNTDADRSCGSGDNSTPRRWAAVVVHEIGHNLGYEHEQDRDDNRGGLGLPLCSSGIDPTRTGDQNVLGTPFDADSIMSYCNGRTQGDSTALGWMGRLSPWDYVAVQQDYGMKPPGSISGLNARCMSVQGGSPALSTPLVMNDCTGTASDTWTRSWRKGNRTFSTALGGPWTMCVDVPNAALIPGGTSLQSYACNNSVAQQYTLDGMRWKAMGDQCVVVSSTATSTRLQLRPCGSAGYYERWDFETDANSQGTRVHLSGTNMCANVPYGSIADGNVISLYPCGAPNPWENEVFTLTGGGEMMYHGKCFNVWGGAPTPGAPIALYNCTGGSTAYVNERFHVTGPIHGQGGQCLEPMFGISRNGMPAQLNTCLGGDAPRQEWDYYFTSWPKYY